MSYWTFLNRLRLNGSFIEDDTDYGSCALHVLLYNVFYQLARVYEV